MVYIPLAYAVARATLTEKALRYAISKLKQVRQVAKNVDKSLLKFRKYRRVKHRLSRFRFLLTTAGSATLLAGVKTTAKEFLSGVMDGMLRDTGIGLSYYIKADFYYKQGGLTNLIANAYEGFIDIDPHEHISIQAEKQIDNIARLILDTTILSSIISPELAEEVFLEILENGIQNAIQYTLGGAMQSIMATFRGSQPMFIEEVDSFIAQEEIDPKTLGLNIAQSGISLPHLWLKAKQGLDRKIRDEMSFIVGQTTQYVAYQNELALSYVHTNERIIMEQYISRLNIFLDAVEDVIRILREAYERALARINETLIELEGTKNLIKGMDIPNYGHLSPPVNIMDYDQAKIIAIQSLSEIKSVDDWITKIKTEVDTALDNMMNTYAPTFDDLDSAISKLYDTYNQIIASISGINTRIKSIKQHVDEVIDTVYTYRMSETVDGRRETFVNPNYRLDLEEIYKISGASCGGYIDRADVNSVVKYSTSETKAYSDASQVLSSISYVTQTTQEIIDTSGLSSSITYSLGAVPPVSSSVGDIVNLGSSITYSIV